MAATAGQPPWPSLQRAAALFPRPGEALDIGAGAGRDTRHLLEGGWRVTAVDSSPSAIEALGRLPQRNLRIVASAAQDFAPSSYDLVNAQFSLPFVAPAAFEPTVERMKCCVKPGGVLAMTFFGPHDEWNTPDSRLTFTTRQEIERLFAGWELIELTEAEEDGRVATGGPKHWHTFQLIARRPEASAPKRV
ncbi:MAG TPA: class I SAM-dependent methyltransferase [Candidatus Dormibacteraeota bacterium]|nr:class I SAM-dependent methyltransferase [Candidatus Dormibacteraeota bacterium]